MAPQILDNFLFGSTKIGQFYIYLNFNRKISVALATFNKNYPLAKSRAPIRLVLSLYS